MKLSTRGRYGVRLMLDLALHYGEGPVLLKDIAGRQGISEKYLWQLINPLKKMGLIGSTRGAHGGYVLARSPSEISLKEIVRVLEGSLCLVDCVENLAVCERSQTCTSRDIWSEASNQISQILESVTLDKMVVKQRTKNQECIEYSI
ncbi:MAG: Rrf2 family transcriptional regulator [Deltaproteobacteria bacterium]|nr:Rrf2 family transcriptional regulator [Deltaproteobacteria bacterium]